MSRMQKNGIFERGDSKDLSGVQCRVWKVQVTEYGSGLENRTICLGVKDHLPYEITSDYDGSPATFSDFNAAIEIPELPSIAASDEGSRASNPLSRRGAPHIRVPLRMYGYHPTHGRTPENNIL
jgi:hypothetical protein